MKAILVNGSRREKGCTFTALSLVAKELNAAGIDTEIYFIGKKVIDGQVDEIVKEVGEALADADAFVMGSPVYYASPSG
ncbi:MAG: NAD(P)H-dependent oxidoreductase, partial [Lachnospiraceae bacterium]|nr:NAD(P)H-dependent oxidoreductase [Lachnospiraceae bacterium]